MTSLDWYWLCGSQRMSVWTADDFGSCFETVALVCPAYALLALFSAYYLGNRALYLLRSRAHLRLLTLRQVVVLGLLLCPVARLGATVYVTRGSRPLPAFEYLSAAVQCFAWLLHGVYLCVLRTRMTVHSRGPHPVLVGWLLTSVVTGFAVRTVIVGGAVQKEFSLTRETVDLYAVYVHGGLQMLYFCTLIPKGSARETFPRRLVNFAGSVRQPLVADSFSESYGAVSGRSGSPVHLGVAERRANVLSRLTLYWVNQLLQKGCAKHLNSAEDLYDLPGKLRTSYVDTKFWIVFNDLQLRRSLASERRRLLESSARPTPPPRPLSILMALLRCFGGEYSLLGVLKLLGDGSAFIGPLLLSVIVNYVEGVAEPSVAGGGYYYVVGLFATTLFSSFCNSQYSYLLNNLKMKVRAALVSTIYRKTLHVRSSRMASFSIGEIVNFMSTDTDCIVNMCDSFHAFWIQPVQARSVVSACMFTALPLLIHSGGLRLLRS